MKTKTITKILLSFLILSGFLLSSCTNSTEPTQPKKLVYNPSQSEVQVQSQSLVSETVKELVESMAGYSKIPMDGNLGKVNDKRDYYYFDGWHTWRGDITKNPFGIPEAYTAEYLGKIQFKDGSGNVQELPDGAESMIMYLNAHAAFGFANGQPYGDEVWYDFDANATPLTGNPSILNAVGTYERRWVGVLNGEDTELHYKLEITVNNVAFQYDYIANDYSLNGNIIAYVNNYNSNDDALYKLMIRFTHSRTALVEMYRNGVLIKTYSFELPNFYQLYNLPSLQTWNFGAGFEFPAPIPLG